MMHTPSEEEIEAIMNEVGLHPHGTWTPDELALAKLVLQARAERNEAYLASDHWMAMYFKEFELHKTIVIEKDEALVQVEKLTALWKTTLEEYKYLDERRQDLVLSLQHALIKIRELKSKLEDEVEL